VLAAASYKPDGQLRRAALLLRPVGEVDEPALALEVPLLRHRGADGAETPLARPQPRVTAAKLAQTLEAALSALSGSEDESGSGGGGGGGAAGGAAPWEAVQGMAWGAGGAAGRQGGGS
jgi:hypothetical protein